MKTIEQLEGEYKEKEVQLHQVGSEEELAEILDEMDLISEEINNILNCNE